jgi:ATP-dependent helicase HrpA
MPPEPTFESEDSPDATQLAESLPPDPSVVSQVARAPENERIRNLHQRLDEISGFDAMRLRKRLHRLKRIKGDKRAKDLDAIERNLAHAITRFTTRSAQVPHVRIPAELPIADRSAELVTLIQKHQVLVVAGETGSGKSTQLPKICLSAGRGVRGLIGHTQPRRLAARTVAERIAEELGSKVSDAVGYKVRFTDEVSERTYIKLMTDGILLAEIQRDPLLSRYDTIIVDEAHERSLNIDFLLGYLHTLLPKRRDLKLIITSATIDTERIAKHFGNAPIVEVSGRTYPVEMRYRPLDQASPPMRSRMLTGASGGPGDTDYRDAADDGDFEDEVDEHDATTSNLNSADDADDADEPRDQNQAICDAVRELQHEGPGDILVFFSGEREIRDAAEALTAENFANTEIVPLFARLSAAEQHRVFSSHKGRRIVLATNIAETSLTVPGIRYVIDPGTARISRFSKRTKVQRLPIEKVSQASANQRAGRCGRLGPGICIRLYSETDFASRDAFTEPEIQRTNLASVILQMASMGLGDIAAFPFVDPPDLRSIRDGVALLEELGAVSGPAAIEGQAWLTATGKALAALPIDPRLGRMLIAASETKALSELIIITAALSIVDPRERPREKEEAARQSHARFSDPDSDFGSWIKLWNFIQDERKAKSSSQFRKMCKSSFLNWLRIREWQDICAQLRSACDELGWIRNTEPANLDRIHQAALTGLLSQLGQKDIRSETPAKRPHDKSRKDTRAPGGRVEYRGARNTRFAIAPGSSFARKAPEWVVAAELTETNRLWARCVAPVNTKQIERAAAHLIVRSHTAAQWDEKRGMATIGERVSLFGLTLVNARQVPLSRIDPSAAREMVIRHALIDGEWHQEPTFVAHNAEIRAKVEAMGARIRRDLIVEDEAQWRFYDQRLPANIFNVSAFDRWWKSEKSQRPELFHLTIEDLLPPTDDAFSKESAAGATSVSVLSQFPDTWQNGSLRLPLFYAFAPGAVDDGITVEVPVAALSAINTAALSWNVPGHRYELIEELIRSLPKTLRRQFVPIADTASQLRDRLFVNDTITKTPVLHALTAELNRIGEQRVTLEDFRLDLLPSYLRLTYSIVNDAGDEIASGKDIEELRRQLRETQREALKEIALPDIVPTGRFVSWDFERIPAVVTVASTNGAIRAFPALRDCIDHVDVQRYGTAHEQYDVHWLGTRRLLRLAHPRFLKDADRVLTNRARLALASSPWGSLTAWMIDVIDASIDQAMRKFVDVHPKDCPGGLIWDRTTFDNLDEFVRQQVPTTLSDLGKASAMMASSAAAIGNELDRIRSIADVAADIGAHMDRLCYPGCITAVTAIRAPDLVRYLVGIERRLERVADKLSQDRSNMVRARALEREYDKVLEKVGPNEYLDEAVWLLEELRISLFAQSVGVKGQVSDKRIRILLSKAVA